MQDLPLIYDVVKLTADLKLESNSSALAQAVLESRARIEAEQSAAEEAIKISNEAKAKTDADLEALRIAEREQRLASMSTSKRFIASHVKQTVAAGVTALIVLIGSIGFAMKQREIASVDATIAAHSLELKSHLIPAACNSLVNKVEPSVTNLDLKARLNYFDSSTYSASNDLNSVIKDTFPEFYALSKYVSENFWDSNKDSVLQKRLSVNKEAQDLLAIANEIEAARIGFSNGLYETYMMSAYRLQDGSDLAGKLGDLNDAVSACTGYSN